jgi:hypothetical protein
MNWRKIARLTSLSLFAVFFALWVASKIHFFTHYDPHNTGRHLREHSVYWLLIAVTASFNWVVEQYSQKI